jgi:1-acyl-sn-glycerol-3-phosphate acyltransferase/phosphopantetheinyl transferase (holo-ACP synthase)
LSALFSYPIYALVVGLGRFYLGYHFKNLQEFRREIWEKLNNHEGPVIWAANHLTLIDSFLIFWAVCPWSKASVSRLVPWSTPEYRNYYHLGGWWRQRMIRTLMYLCRCIPFLREGEDQTALDWRQRAFDKCGWILKNGGSVFIYPEAGRSRSGWLEVRRPKDFLGRLAIEAPRAKFLCIYLRGDRQLYTTPWPARGESVRIQADLIPAVLEGETSPRAISQRLFEKLAQLQEKWFKGSTLPKNCGGNDILDLRFPLLSEHFNEEGNPDPKWLKRHLTAKETTYLESLPLNKRYATFWKFIAAKEATYKALAQSGIMTGLGGWRLLEADLFRRKVLHIPTGCQTEITFTDEDEDKLHCIAILRGGSIGDQEAPGDVLWAISELPPGIDPHEFVRERCLELIASSSDEISSPSALAFSEEGTTPKVLYKGKVQDWGVSLSHSGRFCACSFMIS